MYFRQSLVLSLSATAYELNGVAQIQVAQPGARSFKQLQDFAAEMFNNDKAIKEEYDGDSWTEAFMEYGCYCNKALRGGGKVGTDDSHENLCLELYACYKCINIDYKYQEGEYAGTELKYNADLTKNNKFTCLDGYAPGYGPDVGGLQERGKKNKDEDISEKNLPRHVCECDKYFLEKVLEFHKKCLAGETEYCLNDKYRFSNGWGEKKCKDVGMFQVDHDKCCGEYPARKAYSSENLSCCEGKLTGSTVC